MNNGNIRDLIGDDGENVDGNDNDYDDDSDGAANDDFDRD